MAWFRKLFRVLAQRLAGRATSRPAKPLRFKLSRDDEPTIVNLESAAKSAAGTLPASGNANSNDVETGARHFQTALALRQAGHYAAACAEFETAIRLGCNHWRVGWHLAQAAKGCGNVSLVEDACAAVMAARPDFWFARELPKHARGYYAQCGQDELIEHFFQSHPARSKFFVEVGAFDGVHYSNVRRLHETHDWNGLAIEPVLKNYLKLCEAYKNSAVRCVRAAVGSQEGELDLNVCTYPNLPEWGSDVATFSDQATCRWTAEFGARWEKQKVPVKRLTTILDEAHVPDFDLLSMDTEGNDLVALQSLDFARFRPRLIVVEYGGEREAILHFLQDRGYSLHVDNGQDLVMRHSP